LLSSKPRQQRGLASLIIHLDPLEVCRPWGADIGEESRRVFVKMENGAPLGVKDAACGLTQGAKSANA
jgi:hypothetical protein